MPNNLTPERLREVLRYEPETGVLTWLKTLGSRAPRGSSAGSADKLGYIQVRVDKRDYKAHRLAWLYMTGEWPDGDIDHINGEPSDNRWVNLRAVTHAANMQNERLPRSNNRLGVKGVSPSGKRFKAQITVNGKQFNLGRYHTPEEAHEIYLAAKRKLHKGNTL